METRSLVFFIYKLGQEIFDHCQLAKYCLKETKRIAVRVSFIRGTLDKVSSESAGDDVHLHIGLLQFQKIFIKINSLVQKCSKRHIRIIYARSIAKDLTAAESNLDRQCLDLHLALQPAITKRLKEIQDDGNERNEKLNVILDVVGDNGITLQQLMDRVYIRRPPLRMPTAGASSATEQAGPDNAGRPLQLGEWTM